MKSAGYIEILRNNKNFRRLWFGQSISELGTWFSFIAELGVVRVYSGTSWSTTTLLAARLLPFLILAPFAGVLVDRISRKKILMSADFLRALIALGYLFVKSPDHLWIVYVCGAAMSSFSIFFEGAKNAALPNLVTPKELLSANVMMYSTRFLQFTLGSALGGITAARFGYDAAFVANSVSFAASGALIWLIPAVAMRKRASDMEEETLTRSITAGGEGLAVLDAEVPEVEAIPGRAYTIRSFFEDFREGMAYIRAHSFVRALILVNIGWATGGGMINLVYDRIGGHLFAHGAGDHGDWSVATLYTGGGVGLFIGMLLARQAGQWIAEERRAGNFIGWALFLYGILFSIGGIMPTIGWMAILVGASRMVLGAEFGVQETFMMRVLPDSIRGRVFTTDRSLELGMMTVSMTIGGWMLTWMDPRTMMVISGLLSASPGIVWLIAIWSSGFRVPGTAVRDTVVD
ncbi:MAG TPA: MFS transporter [Blastocatellia bacterium]|nr:MFS transporter [Blastocatellia bacterium]